MPALDAFAPELVLVSAGFDAHRADPLAGLELEDEDFGWVTARAGRSRRPARPGTADIDPGRRL